MTSSKGKKGAPKFTAFATGKAQKSSAPVPDCHRGALAGLSPEERKQRIEEHYNELDESHDDFDDLFSLDDPASAMRSTSRSGSPKFTLKELLAPLKKTDLEDIVFDLALEGGVGLKKAELIDFITESLQDPETLVALADIVPPSCIDRVKEVIEEGGRLYVPEARIVSLEDVTPALEPLMFLYHTRHSFVYVIPDELVDLVREVDWEAVHARGVLRQNVGKLAAAAVELRGVVPLAEFIRECRDRHAEIASDEQAAQLAVEAASVWPLFCVLMVEDDVLLLDTDFGHAYVQEHGDARMLSSAFVMEGPYDDAIESLLAAQGDNPLRPVEDSMLEFPVPSLWRQELPAAVALRAWLDENVPDGADDFEFADRIMLLFGDEVKWGELSEDSIKYYLDLLVDNGLLLGERHIQPFAKLLVDYMNTQPIWPANGWSAADVAAGIPNEYA